MTNKQQAKESFDFTGKLISVGDMVIHHYSPSDLMVVTEIRPDSPPLVMCGSTGSNSTSWHKVDTMKVLLAVQERLEEISCETMGFSARSDRAVMAEEFQDLIEDVSRGGDC